ncbi:MAG: hypothetical protein ACLT2C_08470 [Ruminococcus sp.]
MKLSASGVKEGSLILVNSEHALQLSQEELNLKTSARHPAAVTL